MTGDERATFGIRSSQAWSIGQAPPEGKGRALYRATNDQEWTQTFELEGGWLVSDRIQLGGSFPVRRRERQTPDQSYQVLGLGDSRLSVSAELLPEFVYSNWIPKVFGTFQLTLPTGTQNLGRGLWIPSVSFLALKLFPLAPATLGLSLSLEGHRPVGSPSPETWIESAFGFSATLASSVQLRSLPLLFGAGINPVYDFPTTTAGSISARGDQQLVWNVFASFGWIIDGMTRLEVKAADQTLLGPAWNSTLERSLTLRLSTSMMR